eukprot:TRINITY_DN33710_c0_g1_i1.p1 TRINITY_DN33710_c0_g1~~TRINITY_DN33710_c0_g1_i1.p1  ORF type:complete len:155 (+),score=10.00 TRINITY_DN33710_c0_g1_i1:53-517(+)
MACFGGIMRHGGPRKVMCSMKPDDCTPGDRRYISGDALRESVMDCLTDGAVSIGAVSIEKQRRIYLADHSALRGMRTELKKLYYISHQGRDTSSPSRSACPVRDVHGGLPSNKEVKSSHALACCSRETRSPAEDIQGSSSPSSMSSGRLLNDEA